MITVILTLCIFSTIQAAPRLLPKNAHRVQVEPDFRAPVLFRHLGETINTLGYAHLQLEIDIAEPLRLVRWVRERALNATKVSKLSNRPVHRLVDVIFQSTLDKMDRTEERLVRYLRLDEQVDQEEHDQQKRSALLLGAAILAGSTFLGAYNTYQIHQLNDQAGNEVSEIDLLVQQINVTQQMMAHNSDSIISLANESAHIVEELEQLADFAGLKYGYQLVTDNIAEMTDRITEAVAAVMKNRLSPTMARPGALLAGLKDITDRAAKMGHKLLVRTEADIFQCDTSFQTTATGLIVLVHVPTAFQGDRMQMYQFVSIPLQISDSTFASITPRSQVIAISDKTDSFKTFSMAKLEQCEKHHGLYLCNNFNYGRLINDNIKDSDDEADMCLFHLFRQKHDMVNQTCQVHLSGPVSGVRELTHNQFLMISEEEHLGIIKCFGERDTTFSAGHISKVQLPAGCRAETATHTASATIDVLGQPLDVSYTLKFSPKELLKGLDLNNFESIKRNIDAIETLPTEVLELKQWMKDHKVTNIHRLATMATSSVSLLLVAATAVIIVIWGVYAIYNRAQISFQNRVDNAVRGAAAPSISNQVFVNAPQAPPAYPFQLPAGGIMGK